MSEKDLHYTIILKRKPGNAGFTLTAPAFEELGEMEGESAEELVKRAQQAIQRLIDQRVANDWPIPYEMNIKVKITVPEE